MPDNSRLKKLPALIASILLTVPAAGSLLAQDADDESLEIEEVIVTASKREVNIQDLAMSVKAFSMEDLAEIGADTFTDYARLVPSLSFAERGSGRNRIILRGLGPSVGTPVIGYYVDGIPQQQVFETVDPRLFDVERIEILRGPQGTLYGEGSMGGTILIHTQRPNLDVIEGTIQAEYGNIRRGDSAEYLSGMFNLPFSDTFGIRFVALDRDRGGFIDFPFAPGAPEDANTDKARDYRFSAMWQPNDKFRLTYRYYNQDAIIEFDQAISPAFTDLTGAPELTSIAAFGVMWDWETEQHTLQFDMNMDFANLNITAGNVKRDRSLVDNLLGPAFIDNTEDVNSIEARLVSNSDSSLRWLAGVFIRERDSEITADLPGVAGLFGVPDFIQTFDNQYDAWSVYGEVSWDFSEHWTLTAGGRYFSEDIATQSGQDVGIPGFESSSEADDNFSNFSPKAVLEFRPDDNALYYGSVSQGYRSGGNNVDITADPNFQASYDEDRVTSFELGAKWTLAQGTATINSAIFYNDWKDMQIEGIPGNSSLGFITNGGDAHSAGIEADIAWSPSERWYLTVGGAWIEAETDEPIQGGPEGSKLENVPDFTANASAEYTFPLAGDFNGLVRADWNYRGESFGAIPNSEFNRASSYNQFNARMNIYNDRWTLSLFINNIFDERGSSFSFSDLSTFTDQVFIIVPRTVGFSVQYYFSVPRG